MSWSELAPPPIKGKSSRALSPASVAVPAVIATVLALTGHWLAVGVLVTVVVVLSQATRRSDAVRERVDWFFERVGHLVGRVLTTVLMAVVFVLAFIPASLARLFGAGDLDRLPKGQPLFTTWRDRMRVIRRPSPRRPFDAEYRPARTRPRVIGVLGIVALLVIIDLGAGLLLTSIGLLPTQETRIAEQSAARFTMMEGTPAMAGYPWRAEYFDELEQKSTPPGNIIFEPFTIWRAGDFQGRYINIGDGVRRSYEPATNGAEPLRIGFFGGSTMFGEAQRDEYTIPSQVARLAEASALPVQVFNFGIQGFTLWQEFMLAERVLEHGPDLDLIVFYDGVNELGAQAGSYSRDPTYMFADPIEAQLNELNSQYQEDRSVTDLLSAYGQMSVTVKLLDRLNGLNDPGLEYAPLEDQEAAASDIYRRGVAQVSALAQQHQVPVAFFWQPRLNGYPQWMLDALPVETIDLSSSTASTPQVFVDDVHMNEAGAAAQAQVIFDHLRPGLVPPG